jgi:ATP-dependent 26S proteasome regulatory subunit
LSLLDGDAQIDRIVNLATTNYPEKLDKRIVNRPRRFDQVVKIGMPNEKVRRAYFLSKLLKASDDAIDEWVKLSEDFSFASMAEMVVGVCCLGQNLEETAERLKKLTITRPSSKEDSEVGFL